MKRRTFFSLATLPLLNIPFVDRTDKAFVVEANKSRIDKHIDMNNGNILDIKVSGKDTNGDLLIIEQIGHIQKAGPPMHVHFDQDEIFNVIEGEFAFKVGEQTQILKAGDTIFLPRKVPHVWAMLSSKGRMMFTFQPAGKMEAFFLNASALKRPVTASDFDAYDMKVVGPPLKFDQIDKSLKVSETYGFTIKNGKIIESRRLVDFAAFFEQIK